MRGHVTAEVIPITRAKTRNPKRRPFWIDLVRRRAFACLLREVPPSKVEPGDWFVYIPPAAEISRGLHNPDRVALRRVDAFSIARVRAAPPHYLTFRDVEASRV